MKFVQYITQTDIDKIFSFQKDITNYCFRFGIFDCSEQH